MFELPPPRHLIPGTPQFLTSMYLFKGPKKKTQKKTTKRPKTPTQKTSRGGACLATWCQIIESKPKKKRQLHPGGDAYPPGN